MSHKNTCRKLSCPDCGDALIHQGNRGGRESSSAYGQHIRDHYKTTFFFLDIDGCVFKTKTRVLRVIEHKRPTQFVKNSESEVLRLFSIGVQHLMSRGVIHQQSGVFIVYADAPWTSAVVLMVSSNGQKSAELSGEALKQFETGEIMAEWQF